MKSIRHRDRQDTLLKCMLCKIYYSSRVSIPELGVYRQFGCCCSGREQCPGLVCWGIQEIARLQPGQERHAPFSVSDDKESGPGSILVRSPSHMRLRAQYEVRNVDNRGYSWHSATYSRFQHPRHPACLFQKSHPRSMGNTDAYLSK